MITRNGIPIAAPIVEMIVAVGMLILSIRIIQKYLQKKNRITLYLALTFVSYTIAVFSTAIGKCLQFGIQMAPNHIIYYSDMTIILGYIFTALANIFLIPFIDQIFLNIGNLIALPVTISNGIAIGLFIPALSVEKNAYAKAFPIVIFHVINTMFVMILLSYLAFIERRKNKEEKLARMGFLFIGLFGVFIMLMFISFALDLLILSLTSITGYTPFYYLSWFFALIGLFSGYLGYIMPPWFKKLLHIK